MSGGLLLPITLFLRYSRARFMKSTKPGYTTDYEYHVMFTFKPIVGPIKASARSVILPARSMDRIAFPCICSDSVGLLAQINGHLVGHERLARLSCVSVSCLELGSVWLSVDFRISMPSPVCLNVDRTLVDS